MKTQKQVLLTILLFGFLVYSQNPNDSLVINNTKKIGLVLSGGGAKGFAHIGVLKVIDSLGIKIDYVAGTSMGAIIGSLYASGYTGKQLDSIFKKSNFDDIINDNLPRAAKTFYERENSEKYAITLPFNKFNIKFPEALSKGQNVFNLLSKLTLHISDIDNFEDLPIPFFCIATDAEKGEKVILDSGNLPQCVVASGALPTLFQPVIINDQILIDGGVTDNYPIEDLKAKGMDIIIGVDVQSGLADRSKLTSVLEIVTQVNNFRTIKDMKLKSKKTDIYIKPEVTDFTVVSFKDGRTIIKRGEDAAIKNLKPLQTLPQNTPTRPKSTIAAKDSISINEIEISGNNKYTRAYILGKLKVKRCSTISYTDFNNGVNNLIATNNFSSFKYQFKKVSENDNYNLIATLRESKNKMFLRFGLHYDNLYKSAGLINVTRKRLLFDNDVSSLDIILGDNFRYNFEYFVDKGFYWSFGLKSRFNQFHYTIPSNLFIDNPQNISQNKVEISLRDQTNLFYIQSLFRKDFALNLGIEHKRLNIQTETLSEGILDNFGYFEKTDYFSAFGTLKLDTYDNRYFPKKGFYFDGDFHLYLFSSNNTPIQFSIAKADIGYAKSITNKISARILAQGGFTVGEDSPSSLNFILGGYGNHFINNFVSFYGYDFLTLTGDSFVKSTITLDYEFYNKHHLNLAANYANVNNSIFTSEEWISAPTYTGYALGYAFETFLGPIEAKYSWSPEVKRSYWLFNVGFWF